MKNAIKPLTITSMILIAVGIISAAIMVIYQDYFSDIFFGHNEEADFILPIAYIAANFISVAYSIVVLLISKSYPKALSGMFNIVLMTVFIILPKQWVLVLENIIVAHVVGMSGLSRIAALNSSLMFADLFFKAAFVFLLIASVIARCGKNSEAA